MNVLAATRTKSKGCRHMPFVSFRFTSESSKRWSNSVRLARCFGTHSWVLCSCFSSNWLCCFLSYWLGIAPRPKKSSSSPLNPIYILLISWGRLLLALSVSSKSWWANFAIWALNAIRYTLVLVWIAYSTLISLDWPCAISTSYRILTVWFTKSTAQSGSRLCTTLSKWWRTLLWVRNIQRINRWNTWWDTWHSILALSIMASSCSSTHSWHSWTCYSWLWQRLLILSTKNLTKMV